MLVPEEEMVSRMGSWAMKAQRDWEKKDTDILQVCLILYNLYTTLMRLDRSMAFRKVFNIS